MAQHATTRRRRGAVDDNDEDNDNDKDSDSDSRPQTSSPRTRWREQQERQRGARRVAEALNKGYSPDGNTLAVTLRYVLSALMHVCVVGYVARMMWIGGLWDIGGSFLQVRFGSPCGASPHKEYVVLSSRIVLDKGVVSGGFHVRGGMIGGTYFGGSSAALANRTRILSVLAPGAPDIPVLDFGDKVVGPGIIDTHVHMNEPGGSREGWESMAGATSAAARGGVTMVVDMPLNSDPVTVTARDVKNKLKVAGRKGGGVSVQVGVWGGLVPENARSPRALRAMIRGGAMGFKAFMIDSGIDEFGAVSADDLRAALPVIRDLNVPLLVHAEDGSSAPSSTSPTSSSSSRSNSSYASWLASRPAAMELDAVRTVIGLLKELQGTGSSTKTGRTNFRVHVVHASSAETVDLVGRHRDLPISIETCPHYLLFAAEDIPDGATEYKCAPAIRDRRNNDALVAAVRDGRVDGVASDHSPSPASLKTGDFMASWGGISGVQYTLPAVWESLRRGGEGDPEDLVAVHRVLSGFPARMLGMHHLKGRLADGYHADFVVWDPDAVYDAPCAQTQTLTPYAEARMRGRVLATVVRGKFVYDVGAEDGAGGVHSCGNMAVSRAWLRPHPRDASW